MAKDLKPRRSASKGNLTEISATVLAIEAQVDFLSPTAAFPSIHAD